MPSPGSCGVQPRVGLGRAASRAGAGHRPVPDPSQSPSGRYEAAVAQEVAKGSYDVVFWLRQSRGFIARFFLGSDEDEVVRVEPRD